MTGPRETGFRGWRFPDAPVPEEARGRWCVVSVEGLAEDRETALVHVLFLDAAGKVAGGRFHPRRGTGRGVCFVPPWARSARLDAWSSA